MSAVGLCPPATPLPEPHIFFKIVAKPVGHGFEYGKESISVCAAEASVRPGEKGTVTSNPASAAAAFNTGASSQHNQIRHGDFFPAGLAGVKRLLNPFKGIKYSSKLIRLIHSPSILGR